MEAKFCTDSEGLTAYLLWHSVYPDRFTEIKLGPALLYFKEKNYNKLLLKYWKGMSIPICEYNECLVVSKRIFKEEKIDYDWFMDMWDEIYDIRSDYKQCEDQEDE